MPSLEKRIQSLAEKLRGYRPYCPTCGNRHVNIVRYFDVDGTLLETSGEHCPTCGSPDALEINVHYEDEVPANPTSGWRRNDRDE